MGDGKIKIKNLHSGREESATLLNPDGSLNQEGFARVDAVFQFPTREKGEHISPRLIFMLDYFSDRVAPGKAIKMVSGYRSPDYNTGLRNAGGNVAPTSLHMDGMALDFSIDGVNGKALWQLIKSKDCCGVGHYGGASVHLDAGRPRFWEASTSKVKTGESDYNRRLYLATDYDRYRAGETVRLTLAAVSDFGFGIIRTGALVDAGDGNHTVATVTLRGQDDADCLAIPDRKTAHSITSRTAAAFALRAATGSKSSSVGGPSNRCRVPPCRTRSRSCDLHLDRPWAEWCPDLPVSRRKRPETTLFRDISTSLVPKLYPTAGSQAPSAGSQAPAWEPADRPDPLSCLLSWSSWSACRRPSCRRLRRSGPRF